MKHQHLYFGMSLLLATALTACGDEWSDHYEATGSQTAQGIEFYQGTAAAYIGAQSSLASLQKLFQTYGMNKLLEGKACTAIVFDQPAEGQSELAARNLVSDILIPPTSLTDGFGIYTQSGKNVWVTTDAAGKLYLNEQPVTKVVKATNGYIYHIAAPIAVQPSIYEYVQSLGDDYSMFKEYLAEFEVSYFDADASTPSGVDAMGNTTYSDSVISIKNTLMDRYTENGLPAWDMRSESYQSTVFVPNNDLLRHAYEAALDSVPLFLNRATTAADSLKFRRWVVASCFADRKLTVAEVSPSGKQFECVGGYVQEIDETTDKETYEPMDAAQWNPAVQHVDYQHPVECSNGVAYLLSDYYKIPNHIVIYRVKEKFYNVWGALNETLQGWSPSALQPTNDGYFRWNHWINPLVINDCQGSFELSSTLPTMYYHELTAIPDLEARASDGVVSVDFDGVLYNTDSKQLQEVYLPAGEYNLRMGFKHSLEYSLSIYFCAADEEFSDANCLIRDMGMRATGSDFHFDRAGAAEGLELYGDDASGYPEYFDWRWWYDQDPVTYQKASAYDTDGCQVATVRLNKPGNFKIRIESSDNATFYRRVYGNSTASTDRTKSNVQQLMMYHWCLRPTKNNY